MSYLYDGSQDLHALPIPPLDIYRHNDYKKYTIPDLSIHQIYEIARYNSISSRDSEQIETSFFYLKSLINHNSKPNLKLEYQTKNVIFIFAKEDIEEGEEIFIDYCEGISDQGLRNERLK